MSTLGAGSARERHRELLIGYLREHESRLSKEVRERINLNPLRAFDSSDPGTIEVMEGAPLLIDSLESADIEHFETVCDLLSSAGGDHVRDPRPGQGPDY